MTKKVDMIVDLQFGSTGKGLIAGFMAEHNELYDVVVNCNMPNAGHTYIDSKGEKMVFKVLPNAIVGPNVEYALLGPGSVFSPLRLAEEMVIAAEAGYANFEVVIHPNAIVVDESHVAAENYLVERIGSTGQGSMEAQVEKMRRAEGLLAKDNWSYIKEVCDGMPVTVVHNDDYDLVMRSATRVLAEGSQGHSLSINSVFYPFVTSRDCTPTRFMSDMGIPWNMLRHVVGTCRLHPIRVGGNSGPCWPDQAELTWEALGQKPELTTVTQRVRRVFTWSNMQIAHAIHHCAPNVVFLNFANYARDVAELGNACATLINLVGADTIKWVGWGPTYHDITLAGTEEYQEKVDELFEKTV